MKTEYSIGVIPIRDDGSGQTFCLVYSTRGFWGFPKGHPNEGESEINTALRELNEETGVASAKLDTDRSFVRNFIMIKDGVDYDKTVKYFIGLVTDVGFGTPLAFKNEIPQIAWLPYSDAYERLTYQNDKDMLAEVKAYLESR